MKIKIGIPVLLAITLILGNVFAEETIQEHLAKGDAYEKQGNHGVAISEFSRVIEIAPKKPDGYWARARVYYYSGNYDLAISDYSKGIEFGKFPGLDTATIDIVPDYVYLGRGGSYYRQGNYDQALADFNKAIGINSNNLNTYEFRAMVYYQKKDYDNAWADVHKAADLGYKPDKEDLEFIENLKKTSGREK